MDEKKTSKTGFFDLERDRKRYETYQPASLLKTTEWGLLTVASLLAVFAFPPYFIQILILSFLNANGLLWVTHLSTKGRQRLLEFEQEFAVGHEKERQGKTDEAVEYYQQLIPRYETWPKIAEIARRRIEFLQKEKSDTSIKMVSEESDPE